MTAGPLPRAAWGCGGRREARGADDGEATNEEAMGKKKVAAAGWEARAKAPSCLRHNLDS